MNIAAQRINNPIFNLSSDTNGVNFFSDTVSTLITLFFIGGVIVFVIMLILSAIQWITSGGDKAKATAARERMMNAIIGIIILFSVYAIIQVIGIVFDVDLLMINVDNLNIL